MGHLGFYPRTTGLKVRLPAYRQQPTPSEYNRIQQVTLIRSIR